MRILFIVNPVAGKGKAKAITPLIEQECKRYNIDYTIKYTTGPKTATDLAKEGIKEGYCKIVAVGGDGTLNEVVNGVAGSDVILGVIPAGTGNDFVRSIFSNLDIEKVIKSIVHGKTRKIDLAKCNDTFFINIASGGFDSQVVLESEKNRKFFSGSTSYLVALIKTIFLYKGKKMKVQIDDYVFEKNTLLVAVANGKYYGGGILPAPKADLTDGVFDICVIEAMPKIKMLIMFPKYIKGNHEGIKGVGFFKGKHIRIISEEGFGVNVDGEVTMQKDVNFTIIPKGIRIIAEQ